MHQPTDASQRKSPLAQGRERDELIAEIQGPFWAVLLVLMGLFPNYEKAAKRIRHLFRKRRILFLGRCEVRPAERTTFIYGNQRVKEDILASHEVPLSLMLAQFHPYAAIRRLYDVDEALRPDATMVIGSVTYHWEYHTGTEHKSQVKEILEPYVGQDCVVLFVCKKESHIAKMREVAGPLRDTIFFATYQDVVAMKTPWDRVWRPFDWQEGEAKKRITPPGHLLGHDIDHLVE